MDNPAVAMPFYEDYFDLQLRFASRYAELVGLSLTEAIDRCTNLRRRFGLWGAAGDERWKGFLRRVAGLATHQDILRGGDHHARMSLVVDALSLRMLHV